MEESWSKRAHRIFRELRFRKRSFSFPASLRLTRFTDSLMTPKILLEIAREHARRGATMLRDETGLYRLRLDGQADLLGILIPQSLYYSRRKIEWETTYNLCDGSVWAKENIKVINQIDHIQAFNDPSEWAKKLDELLRDYVEQEPAA